MVMWEEAGPNLTRSSRLIPSVTGFKSSALRTRGAGGGGGGAGITYGIGAGTGATARCTGGTSGGKGTPPETGIAARVGAVFEETEALSPPPALGTPGPPSIMGGADVSLGVSAFFSPAALSNCFPVLPRIPETPLLT